MGVHGEQRSGPGERVISGEVPASLRNFVRRGRSAEPNQDPQAPPSHFVHPMLKGGAFEPRLTGLTTQADQEPPRPRHAQPNLGDRIEKIIEKVFDKL